MTPPSNDPAFLRNSSAAVYSAMSAGDPDAIWLMQGWLFLHTDFWGPDQVKGYLSGVPLERMWILDLFSESNPQWSRTQNYYGHSFFWNTLLNFGGQQGLVGDVGHVDTAFEGAMATPGANVTGVGITMEGIWTNYP
eukprot:UC1_evm5s1839